MKILAVNGSPTKKKGMTNIMMDLMLEGAKEAGADTEYVFLSEKKINYCTGCFNCWVKHPGKCIFNDDMVDLHKKIVEADILLIGTPLYADGMTAQTKTFVDRFITLIKPEFEYVDNHYRHAKRLDAIPKLALVSVCGFYELDNFNTLVDHMKAICKNFQAEYIGEVLKPTSYSIAMEDFFPDHVKRVKEAVKQSGKELVLNEKFNQETLDIIAEQPISSEENLRQTNIFWSMCKEEEKFLMH